MKKIIVGSTGFIGSHFTKFLAEKGEEPITCSRTNSDIRLDLDNENFSELESSIKDGDLIYLFASISSPDYCEKNPKHTKKVNYTNTSILIEKILSKGCKIIFASTDAVYPNSLDEVNENSKHSPIGNYGFYKSKIENKFQQDHNFFIARFSYVFGSDKFSKYLSNNREQNKVIYNGFKRRAVTINDVVQGLYRYNKTHKSINFCGTELVSRVDIAKMYKKNLFHDLILNYEDAPNSFWLSRAKTINMGSNYFDSVLGQPAANINEYLKEI